MCVIHIKYICMTHTHTHTLTHTHMYTYSQKILKPCYRQLGLCSLRAKHVKQIV